MMSDHNQGGGGLFSDTVESLQDFLNGECVKGARWFIGNHYFGFENQCAGNHGTLQHTA